MSGQGRRTGGPILCFGVHVRCDNPERTPPPIRLKAVSEPGDPGEPVVTILLRDED